MEEDSMTEEPSRISRLIQPHQTRSVALGAVVPSIEVAVLILDLGYEGSSAAEQTRVAMDSLRGSGLSPVSSLNEVFPAAFGWSYNYRAGSHHITLRAGGDRRSLVYSGLCFDGDPAWQRFEAEHKALILAVANFSFLDAGIRDADGEAFAAILANQTEAAMATGQVLGASIGQQAQPDRIGT